MIYDAQQQRQSRDVCLTRRSVIESVECENCRGVAAVVYYTPDYDTMLDYSTPLLGEAQLGGTFFLGGGLWISCIACTSCPCFWDTLEVI